MEQWLTLSVNPTISEALVFDRSSGKELLDLSKPECALPGWAARPLRTLLDLHSIMYQYSAGRSPEFPFDHEAAELLARTKGITEKALSIRLDDDCYFHLVRDVSDLESDAESVRTALQDHSYRQRSLPTSYLRPGIDLNRQQLRKVREKLLKHFGQRTPWQAVCVFRSRFEVYRGEWFAVRLFPTYATKAFPHLQFEEICHGPADHSRSAQILKRFAAQQSGELRSSIRRFRWSSGTAECFEHAGVYQWVLTFPLGDADVLRAAWKAVSKTII